jgi:hypothetical protein
MNTPSALVHHVRILTGFLVAAVLIVGVFASGCGKVQFSDDPSLQLDFSADTILFDTVFTTIGSVTLPLKVYNRNNEALRIDEIALVGGADSPFRVNIDGAVGPVVTDWPLLAEDSMWVFLEVTVDPTAAQTPFVIEDELRFNANGQEQVVSLIAWGQNAHFHGGLNEINPLPSCDEVWTDDLPHVIYGIVQVEPGCTLTIEAGTQVHVHDGGGLLVYQSNLDVQGTLGSEVVFQGDRLEDGYEDVPGQWGIELTFEFETEYGIEEVTAQRGGIWLFGGVECSMNYAVLKNGTIGLQVDTTGTNTAPALDIRNTVIHNMSAYGLYAQGGTIDGYNNLFYDCGQSTAAFTLGGRYRLDHCTFANYWSEGVRQSPSVLFTDWYEDINGNIQVRSLEGSEFNNCIFWGNNYSLTDFDELVVSLLNPPASPFIRNSAVDVQDGDFPLQILEATSTDNAPPFASTSDRDFHLTSNNTLWDGGNAQFAIGLDLDGLPRVIGMPDKGCFERQQ